MPKAGIVILNYKNVSDTLECISGLKKIKYPNKIIVVDNGSDDGSADLIKNNLGDDVIFIETGRNLGYAGGNNVGIKRAVAEGCDYICVLNNDTIIAEDFLTPCINELEDHDTTAFVSPAVVHYDTGLAQVAGSWINTTTSVISNKYYGCSPDSIPARVNCDYVSGACIVLRKEIIKEIGAIPEAYFLFFEETEWCVRAKKAGYQNICLGKVKVIHKDSASINKVSDLKKYLMCRNSMVFIRRNADSRARAHLYYRWRLMVELGKTCMGRQDKSTYKLHKRAMSDGWNGKVDTDKFPFIIVRED